MKLSKLFFNSLKETPKEATINSHILMLRASMIRRSAAGLYSYLPLGFRVIKKIIHIVQEEMDKIGGQEFLPPILTAKKLWEETGRYEAMGPLMFRLKDRHNQDYVLGPTHEEAFTDLIRSELSSYRQLPLIVYQVYKKFRDEIRPRFGIMRGREFTMKDAYSYHTNEEDLDKTYQDMRLAYRRFFKRCGLNTLPVAADSGAMGGKASEEFMVKSHVGEETIITCPQCSYVANSEQAQCAKEKTFSEEPLKEIKKVSTPNIKTIEELCQFFKTSAQKFIKTLIYQSQDQEKQTVVVLIRGDLEVNTVKLSNALKGKIFDLAPDNVIEEITNAPVGFAGPVNLPNNPLILADESILEVINGITGANQKDFHLTGVNPKRDFNPQSYLDLRLVKEGDFCKNCQTPLQAFKGIEVGHIFKLGYKYSQDMKVTYLDDKGNAKEPIMGCYGIGIDRTMATVIEQNNDENGIIWPMSIAPYQVILLPLAQEADLIAQKLYEQLWDLGVETLLDDRDARPGVKFKDADLIGIPLRITLGKKTLEQNKAEVKFRNQKEGFLADLNNLAQEISLLVKKEKDHILNQALS